MSTNICFTLQDLIFFSANHLIRLLHPFSPRGKLVHLGKEGLSSTNRLLHAAKNNMPDCVLRDQLYRIAMTEKNAEQLKLTAELHPEYATWIDPDPLETQTGTTSLGGIITIWVLCINLPTILSRFDVIFLVRDVRDEELDKMICHHVMGVHISNSRGNVTSSAGGGTMGLGFDASSPDGGMFEEQERCV